MSSNYFGTLNILRPIGRIYIKINFLPTFYDLLCDVFFYFVLRVSIVFNINQCSVVL